MSLIHRLARFTLLAALVFITLQFIWAYFIRPDSYVIDAVMHYYKQKLGFGLTNLFLFETTTLTDYLLSMDLNLLVHQVIKEQLLILICSPLIAFVLIVLFGRMTDKNQERGGRIVGCSELIKFIRGKKKWDI